MNRCAFIIPIYPKHYDYFYTILPKLYNIVDVYLVFSNTADYDAFSEKSKIKEIIMPFSPRDGIINCKKFYGLKYLMNSSYEYFIVCDAEIDIVTENFHPDLIYNKANDVFINKIIYGGYTKKEDNWKIMGTCANIFVGEDYAKLKSATDDFKLYTWWSNLPVYKRTHLEHFFNIVGDQDRNLTWYHFDYIIYSYYLMLYQGFNIVNVTPILQHEGSL